MFASVSSSKLTASYLAQEGIEVIRNIRDTSWKEGESWDNDIAEDTMGSNYLDYRSLFYPDTCSGIYLIFDAGSGFYVCDSTLPGGKFIRTITVFKPEADIMKVTVEVEWKQLGGTYKVSAQENLYNWYTP